MECMLMVSAPSKGQWHWDTDHQVTMGQEPLASARMCLTQTAPAILSPTILPIQEHPPMPRSQPPFPGPYMLKEHADTVVCTALLSGSRAVVPSAPVQMWGPVI
jgi:hypothetical protein